MTEKVCLFVFLIFFGFIQGPCASSQKDGEVYSPYHEAFQEELVIKPLPDGKVMFHFQFNHRRDTMDEEIQHFNLFPQAVGSVLWLYQIAEFHLTFTQGRWQSERWGAPVWPAPPGVQLWAWLNGKGNTSSETIDKRWGGFVQALGGLFCASLQYMKSPVTLEPHFMFSPEGDLPHETAYVRYASLPNEAVCTENLTPWVKLLPCRKEAGLAALLAFPKLLYDVHWHSMGVHVITLANCTAKECTNLELQLTQTLTLVFDPTQKEGKKDFSLKSLFHVARVQKCPFSILSKIYVAAAVSGEYSVTSTLPRVTAGDYVTFNLADSSGPADIRLNWEDKGLIEDSVTEENRLSFSVNRFLTGYGKQKGGLVLVLSNNLPSTVTASILQVVPWYLQLYFHTMETTLNDVPASNLYKRHRLIPGEDRKSPSTMELQIDVPGNSTLQIHIQFEKVLLHFFEYPPDPNRGFDVGPVVVELLFWSPPPELSVLPPLAYQRRQPGPFPTTTETCPASSTTCPIPTSITLYTTGVSVMMPTPDFSMPYNVITFTCTAVAFFFGQIFRILIRRYSEIYQNGKFVSKRPVVVLVKSVLGLIIKSFKNEDTLVEND